MRVILYPYKIASESARALQAALRERTDAAVLRIRNDGTSRYRYRAGDVLVNWGVSQRMLAHPNQINTPAGLTSAYDKLRCLRALVGKARIPEWTDDREVALTWLREGCTVLARTLLRASSGRGIVVVEGDQELPAAPLYTKYVKKAAEYRVHVFGGRIIHVQEKRRRAGAAEVDSKIRNHDNGWVFCIQDVEPPADVEAQALAAVAATGLDFGAVDVIYNKHYGQAYVLEINTAPGLEGTTVGRYADAIIQQIG
jgi:glutathione synthase/RimK-type ligase-like ATP-grasp enzyme